MDDGISGPGKAAGTSRHDVLAQYPTYLSPAAPKPEPTYSPLVSSLLAYGVAWVAQMAAAIPLGMILLAQAFPDFDATDQDIRHAALLAALSLIGTVSLVGVATAAVVLRMRRVPMTLLTAFLGQVADFVVAAGLNRVSGIASLVGGAVAGIGVMYLLITRRPSEVRAARPRRA